MPSPWKPTASQKAMLHQLLVVYLDGGLSWYRARSAGERVTLASLHSHGLLTRQAWRGAEGKADSAFEYRPSPAVLEALEAKKAARQP